MTPSCETFTELLSRKPSLTRISLSPLDARLCFTQHVFTQSKGQFTLRSCQE